MHYVMYIQACHYGQETHQQHMLRQCYYNEMHYKVYSCTSTLLDISIVIIGIPVYTIAVHAEFPRNFRLNEAINCLVNIAQSSVLPKCLYNYIYIHI